MSNMEKASRPIRSRRQIRRKWSPGDLTNRPVKRLFTPEIKRLLKDWLVRRRENPYPNRDEKKVLANETGLSYTQICNWFANWRRKLKNAGREPQKKTWGNLIKNYNTNAKGNVEQFSICSHDSIWGEEEQREADGDSVATSASPEFNEPTNGVSSMMSSAQSCKYKSHILKKYFYGLNAAAEGGAYGPEFFKWLESTANFIPNRNNYIDWNQRKATTVNVKTEAVIEDGTDSAGHHEKEELDAAEALTTLAGNYRSRVMNK